jgi:ABC-type multidrug transport system ATPase subunit
MSIFELTDPLFLPHHGCDVKFAASPGEVIVLWGENGIGKTTLLQRFYQRFESEAVMVDQKSLDFFYDRSIGVLLDFFSNCQLPGLEFSRFTHLTQIFELSSKRDRLLSQLSGGELQMLKLTLCLCVKKPIYLLDEPFQYLDTNRRKQLVDFLFRLKEEKATVVMVEHNLERIPQSWNRYHLILDDSCLKVGP